MKNIKALDEVILAEMMDFCFENDIEYITELTHYAARYRDDWFQLLCQPDYESKMTEFLHNYSER